jgi:hypothetical protein
MTTIHDDRPHPIPPAAYLRYKENYFFIIMDPERGVFGVAHFNNEPLFNRSRFTLNLNVQGKQFAYANEIPIPEKFAMAESLSDGKLSLRFSEPHKRFDLKFTGGDFSADVVFEARRPTFDYAACRTAAPDMPSFQEVMTMGLNLPFNHQQQSLAVRGLITGGGKTVELNGWGYRDHSWVFRGDSVVARHFWTGLNFPDRAFGMKTLETLHRPGIWAKEGYVSDAGGERALKAIRVTTDGEKNGWPEKLHFEFKDVLDKPFTIEVDVAGRYSDVALHSEKAVGQRPGYEIMESCCPLTLAETGERGVGLIEIGKHPSLERPWVL